MWTATTGKVRERVTSCLFAKNHTHGYLRGIVMGIMFPIYMAQVSVYMQLRRSIQHGELPWFTIDAVIIGIALVEGLAAPFVSWMGYQRRRTTMMAWLLLPAVAMLLMLAIPNAVTTEGTEFCNNPAFVPTGVTGSSAVRLSVMALVLLCCSLAFVALWTHGIGYMQEHNVEGMNLHFGILVAARVLGLMMIPKILHPGMATWIQVLGISIPLGVAILQLLKVPEVAPPAEETEPLMDARDFMSSFTRVLSNKMVMAQIFAMGTTTAALWGFGWHETDIVKAKYLAQYSSSFMSSYADVLRYHFIILAVVFAAFKLSPPAMAVFGKVTAMKVAAMFSLMVTPIYIALVVFFCTQGTIAGVQELNYTQPACSAGCRCSPPYNQLSPVCVVDQMVTYLSPCHAGCSRSEDFGGITALVSCTCGSISGRATMGACGAGACNNAFELHKLVYLAVIIFSVLILQTHGAILMRIIDPRDRSVTFGVASAVIALLTFVCGHLVFMAIRVWTCAWFEGGQCQYHNYLFSYLVGGTSGALTLTSAIISIVLCIRLRRSSKPELAPEIEM